MAILKKSFQLPLLIVVLFLLSFFLFNLNFKSKEKSIIPNKTVTTITTVTTVSNSLPLHLIIPTINVDANIQSLGINQAGEMEIPTNITDVGWFKFGSKPGEKGSAVIAGHLNGQNNQLGVFANLDKLEVGDKIIVTDTQNISTTFIVYEKRLYDSGYADDVFNQSDSPHLNLITCDGLWDQNKNNYTQRLVIFADILK